MTTHPASVNAELNSWRAEGKCNRRCTGSAFGAGATEAMFTGEVRGRPTLYGPLDRGRDLGLGLVSEQPQPAADPPSDDKETTR